MAQSLIFHFRESNTFLSRTNPFIKLLTLLFMCTALVKTNIYGTLLFLCVVIVVMVITKLPIIKYGSELIFFIVISFFIALTSYISNFTTVDIINRVLSFDTAILLSFLLADSTDPSDIARSLAGVLNLVPFVNGWKIASQIELTLLYIPLIFEVSHSIREARTARLESKMRHPLRFIKSYTVSLLDNLLYKADEIAFALDSRGYDPAIEREKIQYKTTDFIFLLFVLLLIGGAFYVS